jgi:hypothetical protein
MGAWGKFLVDHPAVVSAAVAMCALVVSACSVLLTVCSLYFQRAHHFRSVRPIASIPVADYEDKIGVMLKNTGIGPLRVVQFRTTDGNSTEDDLISWMPELPKSISWETFYDDLDGLWIPAGEKVIVLQLSGDQDDPFFGEARDLTRKALAKLNISIIYEDIYSRRMPSAERNLAWFGRHFEDLNLNQQLSK